jgi:hypothetical protein
MKLFCEVVIIALYCIWQFNEWHYDEGHVNSGFSTQAPDLIAA